MKKLKQLKYGIRLLAKKSVPLKKKKKLICQKGGLIGAILAPLISTVAGLAIDRLASRR